jgi:hypothetical protein
MVEGTERIISSGELEKRPMKELVDIYNSTMPRTKVKSFKSTAEGVRMILERLVEVSRRKPSRQPSERRGAPRKPLIVEKKPAKRKGTCKKVRRSTQREIIMRLLKNRTTFEDVRVALRHTRKQAREALRQLCLDLGYGIEEQEDGQLKLIK